jgi:hypothetical protein
MTDRIAALARFLAANLDWWRHRPEVDKFARDIADCARRIRGLVDGPAGQKYLGPCGADIGEPEAGCPVNCECHKGPYYPCSEPGGCGSAGCGSRKTCEGDVYVRRGASVGRCRTCGAEVASGDREAWLDAEVRSRAFRASEIQDAFGVNANLIRQWATPARNLVQVHGHDRDGRALYLLSQVLDVAAGQKAKLAEQQAKRARRQESAA